MKPFGNALLMEWYAAMEFWQFSRRHKRYFSTAFFLYLYSLKSIRYAHYLRIGFAVLQYLDDVLDGDRIIDEDPLHHIERLTAPNELPQKSIVPDRVKRLTSYFIFLLDKSKSDKHNTTADFYNLLERLKYDYLRRQSRLILTAAELSSHHYLTFYYSVNLVLALSRSNKNAAEEEEVVKALSWCSPIRDIREDFYAGLINVPKEVIEQAGQKSDALFETQVYRDWEREEFEKVRVVFDQYTKKENKDPLAGYFMKALKMYAKQYAQKKVH